MTAFVVGPIQGMNLGFEWVWQKKLLCFDFIIVRLMVFYGIEMKDIDNGHE
jgi:hypothetical protein